MAVPMMFQPLVKYAQFEGRSRRSEFWLWVLFRLLVGMALGAVIMAILVPVIAQLAANPHMDETRAFGLIATIFPLYPVIMLVELGLLVPSLAVTVRRLHDTNRSGWWILMPVAVAFGGMILLVIAGVVVAIAVATTVHANPHGANGKDIGVLVGFFIAYAVYLIAVLAADIVFIIFLATEGTRGPNRFGADPKATDPVTPAPLPPGAEAF